MLQIFRHPKTRNDKWKCSPLVNVYILRTGKWPSRNSWVKPSYKMVIFHSFFVCLPEGKSENSMTSRYVLGMQEYTGNASNTTLVMVNTRNDKRSSCYVMLGCKCHFVVGLFIVFDLYSYEFVSKYRIIKFPNKVAFLESIFTIFCNYTHTSIIWIINMVILIKLYPTIPSKKSQ